MTKQLHESCMALPCVWVHVKVVLQCKHDVCMSYVLCILWLGRLWMQICGNTHSLMPVKPRSVTLCARSCTYNFVYLCRSTDANASHSWILLSIINAPTPFSPVCLCLMLVLWSSWGSGLVDFGVKPIQFLRGRLRQVGSCLCRRGGRATDERLRRGRLAEFVDAGVVGVAVVIFHVGEGRIRGGVAGADLGVT